MSGVWLLQKGWGGHNPWKAFYSSTLKRAGDFERLHRVESSLSWRSASAVLTLQHSHNTLMHIDLIRLLPAHLHGVHRLLSPAFDSSR